MTSNPLDDLRQINREQREAQDVPVDTALREPALPPASTEASTEGGTQARPRVRKEGSASVKMRGSKEALTPARKEGSPSIPAEVRGDALTDDRANSRTARPPDLRQFVRNRVGEKRVYQGGVKATLDLAPELSTRFKRYSIDHHNVTLRQMMTELLDAYLSGEGY